jgi:hypothetical protein
VKTINKSDLTEDRVKKYLGITEKGLAKLKIAPPEKSHNRKVAEDFLTMAKSYYSDANFFFEKGELANAFACVNYAHGWLDAGVRMGLFDVGEDYVLFTPAE